MKNLNHKSRFDPSPVDKARITVNSFVADPFGSYEAKRRLLGPVFNLQGGDATEFTFVVGDKDTV